MQLTPDRRERLKITLLDTFQTPDDLSRLVRYALDRNLHEIVVVYDRTLDKITEDLVSWADEQNRIIDLVTAATRQRPNSEDLRELLNVCRALIEPPPRPGEAPYRGLNSYGVEDADSYFGREALVEQIVRLHQEQPFLAVIGASGSGKTSLLNAGVVANLLSTDSAMDRVIQCYPTAHPLESLAVAVTAEADGIDELAALTRAMGEDSRSLRLFLLKRCRDARGTAPFSLIVDQFEELFTLCEDPVERKVFLDNIIGTSESDPVAHVIISLRADFYHRCSEHDSLRNLVQSHQIYIGAMSETELLRTIERPAAAFDWRLQPGLVDLMLQDVGEEPGALPLLSHALLETWKRRSDRELTLAGYISTGRVQGSVATTADSIFTNELGLDEQEVAKEIFLRLTEPGDNTPDTRRRVPKEELLTIGSSPEQVESVLKILSDSRLIMTSRLTLRDPAMDDGVSEYVEVTHEALIRNWPRLQNWLAENREMLRLHRQLTRAARDWHDLYDEGRGGLYQGSQLIKTLNSLPASQLAPMERAFLTTAALLDGDQVFANWLDKLAKLDGLQLEDEVLRVSDYLFRPRRLTAEVVADTVEQAARRNLYEPKPKYALINQFISVYNHNRDFRPRAGSVLLAFGRSVPFKQRMKVLPAASRVYLRRRLPAIIAFASAVLLVLVIAALRGEYVRQSQGYWNEEEPAFAGQITAVAFTPDDPDIVYAVAAWGATSEEDVVLIRGDLRTDQWEPVAQNVTDFSVSSIVVMPYQGRRRIYLSIIGRGIIRSDDDGQTWIGLSQGLASYNLVQLIAHPTDPLRLFAASVDKRGVFETHDGGDTWADISDNALLGVSVSSMAISTADTPQLLVGTEHGQLLTRSLEGEATWLPIVIFPGTGAISSIAVDLHDGQSVYAGTTSGLLLQSVDGGQSWRRYLPNSDIFAIESVAIMPDQPEHVFLSGYGVGGFVTWVSHDGGQNWQRSGDNSFTRQQHRIVAVPSERPTLLAYGVAGLFESTIDTDDWVLHELGAPLAIINHLAVSQIPDGPSLFSNGGAVFQRSGLSNSGWQRGTGLPTMMVTDLYMHPTDPQIALASSFVPNEWSFFRTTDGGYTWHRLGNVEDSPDKLWHHTTASAVTNDGDREIIYVGTVGCGLMVSDDGGNTWETTAKEHCVPPEGTPRNISDLVVFTDNPDSVVATADHNRIYRTTDQGNTWTFSELEIADELEQIAVDAVLQDVVYAINSTDFWRSNDRGQTWESIADDLDGEHIAQFVPVTGQAEVLFAIMRSGTLWKSNDGGYSWRQLRKNSELRGVTAVVYDPHSSSLLVGTARSGLYRFQQGPWVRWWSSFWRNER